MVCILSVSKKSSYCRKHPEICLFHDGRCLLSTQVLPAEGRDATNRGRQSQLAIVEEGILRKPDPGLPGPLPVWTRCTRDTWSRESSNVCRKNTVFTLLRGLRRNPWRSLLCPKPVLLIPPVPDSLVRQSLFDSSFSLQIYEVFKLFVPTFMTTAVWICCKISNQTKLHSYM